MLELDLSFCDEKFVPKQILDWVKVEIDMRYEFRYLSYKNRVMRNELEWLLNQTAPKVLSLDAKLNISRWVKHKIICFSKLVGLPLD